MNKTPSYKIVLLGISGTGKSSLSTRLTRNIFTQHESTIGASFSIMRYNQHKFEIWDTGGQERFLALVTSYYRKSDIYLLVFDTSDLEKINKIDYFIDKIKTDVNEPGYFILVGNKIDMTEDDNIAYIEKILKKKIEHNIDLKMDYIFVSSKTGESIESLKIKIINIANKINKPQEQTNININSKNIKYPCGCV
jgi:small GTP-binding protein